MKGQITIMISLLLSVLLGTMGTLVEVARYKGAEMMTAMITDGAVDSVCSEYQKELLERYDLFFIDASYGQVVFSGKNIGERVREFASYSIQPEKTQREEYGVLRRKTTDLWRVSLNKIGIPKYILATDQNGYALRQQAIAYMKSSVPEKVLEKVLDWTKGYTSVEELEEDLRHREQENDEEIKKQEQAQKEADQDQPEVIAPETSHVEENPIEVIKEIKEKGVLAIVAPKVEISDVKYSTGLFPSKRKLEKGTESVNQENHAMDKVLFQAYCFEKFSDGCEAIAEESSGTTKGYTMQIEYLLAGQESDLENLKQVVHQLLLIREASNFTYLLTDEAKCLQAESVALTIAGVTGIPPLVSALKYGILLAWAYGESLVDVRQLLAGERVALVKNRTSWNLGLDHLSELMQETSKSGKTDEQGLSYQDYLQILLYLTDDATLTMRVWDLIELDMRGIVGNEAFLVDHLVSSGTVECDYDISPLFMTMFSANRAQRSIIHVEREFSYDDS